MLTKGFLIGIVLSLLKDAWWKMLLALAGIVGIIWLIVELANQPH